MTELCSNAEAPEAGDFALVSDQPPLLDPAEITRGTRGLFLLALFGGFAAATVAFGIVVWIFWNGRAMLEGRVGTAVPPSTPSIVQDGSIAGTPSASNMPTVVPDNSEPQRTESFRQWIDSTGTYRTVAKLVGQSGEMITLVKETGATVIVPIARLSYEDQRYLKTVSH